jgi:hypothetical protein
MNLGVRVLSLSMSGYRRHFQMSLSFMLFLLIVGGPLLGVIVPPLVLSSAPAEPPEPIPGWAVPDICLVVGAPDIMGVVEGELPWVSDSTEFVESKVAPGAMAQ